MVAIMKSSVAAANNALESVQKAVERAAEVAEATQRRGSKHHNCGQARRKKALSPRPNTRIGCFTGAC